MRDRAYATLERQESKHTSAMGAPSTPRVVMLLLHHDRWPTDDRAIIFLDTDELVSYLRTGHHDLDLLIVSVLRHEAILAVILRARHLLG